MRSPTRSTLCLCAAAALTAAPATLHAQPLQDRIDAIRAQRSQQRQQQTQQQYRELRVDERLATRISVNYQGVGLREALKSWSQQTGVRLLVNWDAFENDGVDADFPITLELHDLPAVHVLLILMDVGSTDFRFVAEIEPWGVQLRTRAQANRDVKVQTYDVADLVQEIPHFDEAPDFDLGEALQGGSGGSGGGGGSSSSIFGDDSGDNAEEPATKRERGEQLAETVRQTVEPDIWQSNGGEFSSVHYRQGQLIVRAPAYVHLQLSSAAVVPQETGFAMRPRAGLRSAPKPVQAPEDGPSGAGGQGGGSDIAGVADSAGDVGGVAAE